MSQQDGPQDSSKEPDVADAVDAKMIQLAGRVIGLEFTAAEAELMTYAVNLNFANYETIHETELGNAPIPAFHFDPRLPSYAGPRGLPRREPSRVEVTRPSCLEELAFYPVFALAELVRTRAVKSVELTGIYLNRLKNLGPQLSCVATLTEDLAWQQAERADAELSAGRYRGPLHGIPYGLKDLFATRDYPTSWGAPPYRGQMLDADATVVTRLAEAGAVLVAKLSMGSLAWDDVWYGGKTKNPWDLTKGSSGSSAGSGAATAAGLVAFAIGTETNGSIISPSRACGVSGLRPTFGRVSRHGGMTLSWTLDKVGPMCRTVEDCALVFDAIRGPDEHDPTVVNASFAWEPEVDMASLRIGYIERDFDVEGEAAERNKSTLEALKAMGATLVPIALPEFPLNALQMILYTEAAAAFDELTRNNRDDLLIRQEEKYWANQLRVARLVPAVEYIQVQRIRRRLIEAMAALMQTIDLYVAPAEGDNVWVTNLSGHPAVTMLNGFLSTGLPTSISLVGQLDDEARLLAVAKQYQMQTSYHKQIPPLFAPGQP
jgi:Asp-tRNA(Asn)/Glu-tRNA(Gln) amidotransferase A subunit family amidase